VHDDASRTLGGAARDRAGERGLRELHVRHVHRDAARALAHPGGDAFEVRVRLGPAAAVVDDHERIAHAGSSPPQ
jgi:hypothetical protein